MISAASCSCKPLLLLGVYGEPFHSTIYIESLLQLVPSQRRYRPCLHTSHTALAQPAQSQLLQKP